MNFQRISCDDAQQKLADGSAVLVDIRDPAAFAAGHVPGALHLSNQNVQDFVQNSDPDRPVLVMCYHGHSSQNAAQFLVQQGFTQVFSVDGGFERWKLALPVERS
jgi:thiosulfate sulfurtransferase